MIYIYIYIYIYILFLYLIYIYIYIYTRFTVVVPIYLYRLYTAAAALVENPLHTCVTVHARALIREERIPSEEKQQLPQRRGGEGQVYIGIYKRGEGDDGEGREMRKSRTASAVRS